MIGHWRIHRVFTNSGIIVGQAEGVVRISTLDDTTLFYREEVVVFLFGNAPAKATREYKFVLADGRLTKMFVEPQNDRTFYALVFSEGCSARGSHLCLSDHYNASYNISDHDHFSIRYDISGPSKNHIIITDFCRLLDQRTETSK